MQPETSGVRRTLAGRSLLGQQHRCTPRIDSYTSPVEVFEIALVVALIVGVWFAIAVVLALGIGKAIRLRDMESRSPREASVVAPETRQPTSEMQ